MTDDEPFTPEAFLECLVYENERLQLLLRLAKIRAECDDCGFEDQLFAFIFADRWRQLRN